MCVVCGWCVCGVCVWCVVFVCGVCVGVVSVYLGCGVIVLGGM